MAGVTNPTKFDIFMCDYPEEEKGIHNGKLKNKRRPVLFLKFDSINKKTFIGYKITKVKHPRVPQYTIKDWKKAGLQVQSYIDLNKTVRIRYENLRYFGKLQEQDITNFMKELYKYKQKEIDYTKVKYEGVDMKLIKDESLKEEYEDIQQNLAKEQIVSLEQETGLAQVLSDLIQDELQAIDGYNSAIATFDAENQGQFRQVFEDIIKEENNHIGQLQKVLDEIKPQTIPEIDKGQEEAEEQIAEQPVNEDYIPGVKGENDWDARTDSDDDYKSGQAIWWDDRNQHQMGYVRAFYLDEDETATHTKDIHGDIIEDKEKLKDEILKDKADNTVEIVIRHYDLYGDVASGYLTIWKK